MSDVMEITVAPGRTITLTEGAGVLAEMARQPGAKNPASFGEIAASAWEASGLDTLGGVTRPMEEAYTELSDAFRNITGETVAEAARRTGARLSGGFVGSAEAIRQMAGGLDAERQKALEPYLDVRGRARTKAADIEARAADVADRTFGFSGHAVAFMAGAARQAIDPINLATMPLGAARGASLLRFLGTEAAVGFATQAAQEPLIQAERARLGLNAGFGEGLANALSAGVGAAGIAGLLRGAGYVLRRGFGASMDAPPARMGEAAQDLAPAERADGADPALRAALRDLDPEDFDAVARQVERDVLIDEAAIVQTGEGRMLHVERVDAAAAALESGRIGDLADSIDLEARMDAQARRLDPALFGEVDAIDARRAGLRAELDRLIADRAEPPAARVLEPRIAELEAKLDAVTGKRRSAPSTQALRDEIASLRAEQARHAREAADLDIGRERALRLALTETDMERARLGPRVRAARELAEAAPDLAFAAPRAEAPPAPIIRDEPPAGPPPAAGGNAVAEPQAPATLPGLTPGPDGRNLMPKAATPEAMAVRADVARILADPASDKRIAVMDADGKARLMPAEEVFARIDADARAAAELRACLGVAA